jgi:hypothetical protein
MAGTVKKDYSIVILAEKAEKEMVPVEVRPEPSATRRGRLASDHFSYLE